LLYQLLMETELRLTIDRAGYRALLTHFESSIYDDLHQWNIFFDTSTQSVAWGGMTLRLRSVASLLAPVQWVATVKRSGEVQGGVWRRPEIEATIPAASARAVLNRPSTLFAHLPAEFQEELAPFKSERFEVVGDFRNFRRVIPFDGLHLECDESVLPDHSAFWEIEIETEDTDRARDAITAKLAELEIEWAPSPKGKFRRLLGLPREQRKSMPFSMD
jgi:uncharacterized protein YjbK